MEKQANYDVTVQRTYTITLIHVNELDQMEEDLGTNKSELVRLAIDHYYNHYLENEL